MPKRWFSLLLILALSSVAVPGLMASTLPLNTWESFTWDDGGTVPFATAPTPWTFTTTQNTQLQVTDGYVIGDEFSIAITGTMNEILNTSAINPALDGTSGSGTDGASAWADTDYSRAAINLTPGTYSVTVNIIKNAAGQTSGGAFLQDATVTPEPGSIALLAMGLLGAAFLMRRRLHSLQS
jgi:hypothetical protein